MSTSFEGLLNGIEIKPAVLAMVDKDLMEKRCIMPISFDEVSGMLTIVTSSYNEVSNDIALLTDLISEKNDGKVRGIVVKSVTYENLTAGYNYHYKQPFSPATAGNQKTATATERAITTEQTKTAEEILRKGIDLGASDIHITPWRDSAHIQYRVDGKLRNSDIVLSKDDEITICNYYKRKAGKNVNPLMPEDGRFNYLGTSFRLSTMPYGGDGERSKVVLRLLSSSDYVPSIDELGFTHEEVEHLRRLIYKPSGIMLVCGPTGEGKSTTLYSLIAELNATGKYVIITFEDPIERYIDGIAQSQIREAEDPKNNYGFPRGMRSALRQDPDVIEVGEIRDAETALVSVQASQTGHLIFSTLHVRNSISVFRRLHDIGVNVSGFSEQIIGIASQRLLSKNCPHCRQRIESPLNNFLRQQDLDMLEEGKYTYKSTGCEKCGGTGYSGRVPLIEIIEFNNYLRDYFAEKHGLVDIEKFLRKEINFKSLWDKGMQYVKNGDISLDELLSRIEPDEDLTKARAYTNEPG